MSLLDSVVNQYRWPKNGSESGICYYRSMIRTSDIRDGMSHVILSGEKWVSGKQGDESPGSDNGNNQSLYSGVCYDILRWTDVSPAQDGNHIGSPASFGSAHAKGFGIVMCDGSVRVLDYAIHPEVLVALGGRDDGGFFDP